MHIPQTTTLYMTKWETKLKSSKIKLIFIIDNGFKDHEQCCCYPYITITV